MESTYEGMVTALRVREQPLKRGTEMRQCREVQARQGARTQMGKGRENNSRCSKKDRGSKKGNKKPSRHRLLGR